jgi:hypothetical protein
VLTTLERIRVMELIALSFAGALLLVLTHLCTYVGERM